MKWLLATAAYSNPDLLEKCLRSWPAWVDKLVYIDGYNKLDLFRSVMDKFPSVTFAHYEDHLGCSGSWNWLLSQAFGDYQVICVVGSDIEMKEGFLESYKDEFESQNLEFALTRQFDWNCWAMTKRCYGTVGCLDESFFPAYYEDNDYHRRVNLSGLPQAYIGNPELFWHHGSATINLDAKCRNANNITFGMNQMYYVKKWGGTPSNEVFEHPFNDPSKNIKYWKLDETSHTYKKSVWNN